MYWSPISCALQLNFAPRENKQRNVHNLQEPSIRCVKEGDVYTGVSTIRYRKTMLPRELQLELTELQTRATITTEMTSKLEQKHKTIQEEITLQSNMEVRVNKEFDDEETKEFWSHVCHVAELDGLHFHAFTSSSSSSSSSSSMINKNMKPLEINNYKVTVVHVAADSLVNTQNNTITNMTPSSSVKKGTTLKVIRVIDEDDEEEKLLHEQHHYANINNSSTNDSRYTNNVTNSTNVEEQLSQESINLEEYCKNNNNNDNKKTWESKDKAVKRESRNAKCNASKNNKKLTAIDNAIKSSFNSNESSDAGSKIVQFEQSELLPLHCEVELTISFSGVVQDGNTGAIYSPFLSQSEQHQRDASQSTKYSSSSSKNNEKCSSKTNSITNNNSYSSAEKTTSQAMTKRNGKSKMQDKSNKEYDYKKNTSNGVLFTSSSNNEMQIMSTEAVLLTHFEVRLARCAFPCPDDPHYRIKWQLQQLTLPLCYHTVVSNGEVLYLHSSEEKHHEQNEYMANAISSSSSCRTKPSATSSSSSFAQNYSTKFNRSGVKRNMQQGIAQYSFAECGPLPAYVFAFACFAGPPLLHVEETSECMNDSTCLSYVTEYLSSLSSSSSSLIQKVSSSSPVLETIMCAVSSEKELEEEKQQKEVFTGNVNIGETRQATQTQSKCKLLESVIQDMEEMHIDNYEDVELQVNVMAMPGSGVSMQTLHKVAQTAIHAITWLEHFFHCPLPLLMCSKLIICIVPTMPYISGMEHHCCIFLNQSIYTDKKSFAGSANKGGSSSCSNNREVEQVELVIHELAHHWIGNALGLSFAQKEGVCQLLEQLAGDVLRGKSMRKLKPTACIAALPLSPSTTASKNSNYNYNKTTNTSCASEMQSEQDCKSDNNNSGKDTLDLNASINSNVKNTNKSSKGQRHQQQEEQLLITQERKTEAIQKGNEFTGHVYQHALLHIRNIVAERGFDAFAAAMQKCVCEHLLLELYGPYIMESFTKHNVDCADNANMKNECDDQGELVCAPYLSQPQFFSYFCESSH